MKFNNFLGLIGFYGDKWTVSFFIRHSKYWLWGYKYIDPKEFPYWEAKCFGLGPIFYLYILKTDMKEWMSRKY